MKHIRTILKVLTFIYLAYAGVMFIKSGLYPTEYKRCGTVTFKGNRDQVNKHSTYNEFVIVVKFEDSGKKEDMIVSAATWSSFEVGDGICFTEENRFDEGFFGITTFLIGFVVAFLLGVCCVIIIIFFFRWVFVGKTFKETWEGINKD